MGLIEGVDFFVRVVNFPVDSGCDGSVTPNSDGTFSIYLDARTTSERRRLACDHEIRHITHNDFYRDVPVCQMEAEADLTAESAYEKGAISL